MKAGLSISVDFSTNGPLVGEAVLSPLSENASGFSESLDDITLQITAMVLPLPDYNGNGEVDAADFTLWRDTLGTEVVPFTGADGDGDGMVGAGDYERWKSKFGDAVPAANGDGFRVVPEPSGLALFLPMLVVAGIRRRYRSIIDTDDD